jgi:hypothetical protein
VLEGQSIYLTREGYEAMLLALAGQGQAAQPFARRALAAVNGELQRRPNDARVLLHAAQMHSLLGEHGEAERRVRRILTRGDLAAADAFDRGLYLRSQAVMLALAGRDAEALEALRATLREPNQTSVPYIALHPALARFAKEFP